MHIDSRRLVRASGVVSTPMGDQLVLLSDELRYIGLDRTGQEVWALLAEPRTVAEVVEHLVARFDVAPEQCRADVTAFLGDLDRYGVVTDA